MTDKNSGSKYRRVIHDLDDPSKTVTVDVYSVTDCFDVTSGPIHHAVKKLLCAGLRGAKSRIQDLRESADAIQRAIQIELVKEAMRAQPDDCGKDADPMKSKGEIYRAVIPAPTSSIVPESKSDGAIFLDNVIREQSERKQIPIPQAKPMR